MSRDEPAVATPAPGHDYAAVHQIGRQLGRAAFKGYAHRFQNAGQRLLQGFTNFFRANG